MLESEGFESGLGNWVNVSGGDTDDWTRDSGGTPSSGTGPNAGAGGSAWYMYMETSTAGAHDPGDSAILEGPDIASANNRSLRFFYHMVGADIGTLNVDVLSGGTWINGVFSLSGTQQSSQGDPYSEANVDLSGFSGTIRVRFRAVAAGDWRGDIAIDNVEISGVPGPPVNQAPAVDAGGDQTVILPADATLDATVTDDGLPAGASVTTSWTMVSGPGQVTFGDSTAVDTTASFSAVGTYVLRLSASDTALSASDDVEISGLDAGGTPVVLESEGFENGLGNWANVSSGDTDDWTRDSNGTSSNNTGPEFGSNGSTWYVYLETSSSNGAFDAGDSAILLGPTINGDGAHVDVLLSHAWRGHGNAERRRREQRCMDGCRVVG